MVDHEEIDWERSKDEFRRAIHNLHPLVVSPIFFSVLSMKSHLTCPCVSFFRYDGTQDTKVTH
jgi:hypothetical protein